MNVYLPNLRLPSAYQEVEYIETTGTQWINTNLFSGTNIQTEVKIGITKATMSMPIFGCYTTYSTPRLYYHLTPYSNAWYFGYNGSEGHGGSINFVVGQTYEIVYNDENGYLNVDGNNIVSVSGTTGYPGSTLGIAQRGTNHTGGDAPYYRYYYFKMYNKTTGEYERDLVPCYRKSDNVIGMYDLVNSVFYTNSGTGTFSKGNDVTMAELKNAYIGEYIPRQPSSDTLIYYPLTSNLVDQMGHGNTGTAHGNVTFNSTTGCRVLGKNSSIYADGMSLGINGRLNFTLNFRAKYDTDSTNSSGCLVGYGTNTDSTQCFKLEYFAWQSPAKVRMRLLGNITVPTSMTSVVSPTGPLLGEWYNYCITMNNGVCKMYGNGEHLKFNISSTEYDSVTFSSVNNISELQLGWGGSYGSGRSANGYIKDYIVETVSWDDNKIADYYNYTKSNYGL